MGHSSKINLIRSIQEKFNSIEYSNLYREKTLPKDSLKDIKPLIDNFIKKLESTEINGKDVSNKTLDKVYNIATQIYNVIIAMTDRSSSEFLRTKPAVAQQITTHYDSFLDIWPQIAAIENASNKDNSKLLKNLKNDRLKLQNEFDEKNKLLEDEANKTKAASEDLQKQFKFLKTKFEKDTSNLENRLKKSAPKAEFLASSGYFEKEAENNFVISIAFLGLALASISVLGWYIYDIFQSFCFETKCIEAGAIEKYQIFCEDCPKSVLYFEMIKAIIIRLFIISIMSYIIRIFIKNYNAKMHNYTVNKQRSNSLYAAFSLMDRAKTDQGNDDIIHNASQALFAHQQTGYLGKIDDPKNPFDPEKFVNKVTK